MIQLTFLSADLYHLLAFLHLIALHLIAAMAPRRAKKAKVTHPEPETEIQLPPSQTPQPRSPSPPASAFHTPLRASPAPQIPPSPVPAPAELTQEEHDIRNDRMMERANLRDMETALKNRKLNTTKAYRKAQRQ